MTELLVKMDIKDECNRIFTICQGCLSADRKLKCITGQTKALFIKLREDVIQNEYDTRGLLLCWECVALLNKMKYFQARIKTAQCMLVQYLHNFYDNQNNIPHTLSLLTKTTHKAHCYNYVFEFDETDKKDLLFEQNDLILDQKDLVDEQKDLIFEQKEETEEEIPVVDIKIENNELIKEEYDESSVNNDPDYFESDVKMETNEDIAYYQKPKKFDGKLTSRIKKYEQFATVTKVNGKYTKNDTHYYDTVYVNSSVIEKHFKDGMKNRNKKTMKFRCKICNFSCNKRLDYLRHNTFNHSQLQYPSNCVICKHEILSESHLEEHWKKHNQMFRCTFCSELVRCKAEMPKHLNRSHTKNFSCNYCPLEFRTLGEFSKHYIASHERATCDYCNKNVSSKRRLETHIKNNHLPGRCSICVKDFPTCLQLQKHMKGVHPELVPNLINEATKEIRYCVECDKQFPTITKYKRHLYQSVVHTPRKKVRIPCPACDKIFSKVSYKNNHYRLIHLKKSKHYCELCNKYFSNGFGLRTHILHVHQKVPKLKDKICDLCGRGFSSNKILANHRRTHTGERPFKCEYCSASFAQQYAMKTHQKTQHKNVLMLG